jgi:hypothetical protein
VIYECGKGTLDSCQGMHRTSNDARECQGLGSENVEEIPRDDKLLDRRHRALELAREHISKTQPRDQYDKSLSATNRLVEELKVARFLLGDYGD